MSPPGMALLFLLLVSGQSLAATITVTLPGSVREIDAGSLVVTGAATGLPEATATSTNTNSTSITTNLSTLSNNALLLDVVGSGNGGGFSPGSGQSEHWDETNFSATGASSSRVVATPGVTSMTQSHSTTSIRTAHAVMSLAPSGAAAASVDSAASNDGASVSSLSWTHNLPGSGDFKILVGIAIEEDSACPSNSDVQSVTYDGSPMTRIVTEQIQTSNNFCMRVEFWYADVTSSTPATPTVQWRMDELLWNGTSGEVVDSIGGFDGTAFGASTVAGLVCNAGDFSATGTSDYLSVDSNALDGLTDFTISVWGKTANSSNQAIFSGSSGSQHNELIMWFSNATTFTPFLKGSGSGSITIPDIADDNWHHLVWTRSGDQNCMYVDGALQGCVSKSTLALSIASGGLIIAQEQDSLGGGFDANQDWEGLLDEPLIFNQAISAAEVSSIYNNQLAGDEWDGSARVCPVASPSRRILLSTNGGATLGGLTFEDEDLVDYTPATDTAVMFAEGDTIFDNDEDVNAVHLLDNGNIILSTEGNFSIGGSSFEDEDLVEYNPTSGTATLFLDGDAVFAGEEDIDGVHVLDNGNILLSTTGNATIGGLGFADEDIVEYNPTTGNASLYLDGSAVFSSGTDLKGIYELDNGNVVLSVSTNGNISLGGLTFSDEDLVEYDRASDTATLFFDGSNFTGSEDVDAVHVIELPVSSGPDHIEIVVTAGASTCVPKDVTVRICADAGCSSLFTGYTGTIDLVTSTGNGDWSTTGAGILNPDPDNDDNGAASYAFVAGDAGTVTMQLANTHADDLTITATDSADSSLTDTSGTVNFRDNAFVILDNDSLAGADLAVAGRAHNYSVTLFQRDTSQSPANCAIATGYSGSKDLKGWITRTAALPASANAPQIGAATLPGAVPGVDNLSLNFIAGVAAFDLDTSDVGQFAINLRDDSRIFASGVDIDGTSNNLTVRPFGLDVDFVIFGIDDRQTNGTSGASYTADENGSIFVAAGATFQTKVAAVVWQSTDDADDDGIPDAGANLTDNASTATFGQETATAEQVSLTHTLVEPAAGSAGVFAGSPVAGFTNGQSTANTSWSEVGIIDLAANLSDGDYLGSGSDVTGSVANVGRFIPDRFELSAGTITEACVPGSGTPFTYLDQDFVASYILTARNAGGATTSNYRDGFIKLNTVLGNLSFGAADLTGPTALSGRLSEVSSSYGWNNDGTGSVDSTLNLARTVSPDGAFAADIGVVPTDADGVTIAVADLDLDTDNDTTDDHVLVGQSVQRYGRVIVNNAFGPEPLDLGVTLQAEYFNGAGFVINADDSCMTYMNTDASLTNFTGNLSMGETSVVAPLVATPLVNGRSSVYDPLLLSAPMVPNDGSVEVVLDVDAWLEFDFDTATPGNEDPSGIATFGQYRGNDRVIYWRELIPVQ